MSSVQRRIGITVCLTAVALAASVQAGSTQETRLLFPSLTAAGSPNSQVFNAWAKRVNDASQGTLKVEVRDGTTLANFGNTYDRVMNDIVQIGWVQHGIVAGKFPLSEVTNLPFLSDGHVRCSVTLWQLYKSGLLDAEYKDAVPLWFNCLTQAHMHLSKQPPSVENLGGLKVRVNSQITSQIAEIMGATPISMGAENMYESLQRGTIDGAVVSWSAFEPYKLNEVTSYHLEYPLGATPSMFFMSKKKFDALPPQARKALMDNSGEAQSRAIGEHFAMQAARARAPVAAAPDRHKIVTPTGDELKKWGAKTEVVRSNWVKGRPGADKVLEKFQSLYEQVKGL